jgi:hypothetical protein
MERVKGIEPSFRISLANLNGNLLRRKVDDPGSRATNRPRDHKINAVTTKRKTASPNAKSRKDLNHPEKWRIKYYTACVPGIPDAFSGFRAFERIWIR